MDRNGHLQALVLTRVSTEKQADISPDEQAHRCLAFCQAKGWSVVEVVQEVISGRKDLDKRALDGILRRRDWDVLVVLKLDRLARRARIIHDVLETIEKQGRKFASVSESVDTTTPMGWGFMAMTAAFAEIESRVIAERAKFGHAASKRRGYKTLRRLPKWFVVKEVDGKRFAEPGEEAYEILKRMATEGPSAVARSMKLSSTRQLYATRDIVKRWKATGPWILPSKRSSASGALVPS